MIAAVTMDGKIAKHPSHNVDWTSPKDKDFFRSETKKAGVVIFGNNTYKAMGTHMEDRLNIIMTRSPKRYQKSARQNLLEFTDDSPSVILDKLAERGYASAVIGGGSEVYSLYLAANLVDEIYLTIVPKIFGKGVPLFQNMNIPTIASKLIETRRLGTDEILLKYLVLKSN